MSPDRVAHLMRRAKVVVVPSLDEPFGMVVVEAMAAGAAVLASDVGGIPEVVTHEVDGLLVPPGDAEAWSSALRRLLDDEVLRERLSERAVSGLGRFDEESTIPELFASYRGPVARG